MKKIMNRLEVYATRFLNNQLIAVKADMDDIISMGKMIILIELYGYEFYIVNNGKELDFTYEKKEIKTPPIKLLKKLEQF